MNRRLLVLVFVALASCTTGGSGNGGGGPVGVERAGERISAGAQIVDVRTEDEWKEGHIKGARLITSTESGFLERAKASLDPDRPVLVYCRSGKRSEIAAGKLREAGFSRVDELEGGILAWQLAGLPTE